MVDESHACEEILEEFRSSASSLDFETLALSLTKLLVVEDYGHVERKQKIASNLIEFFPFVIVLHMNRKDILNQWLAVLFDKCGYWTCICTMVDNNYFSTSSTATTAASNSLIASFYVLQQILASNNDSSNPLLIVHALADYILHETEMITSSNDSEEAMKQQLNACQSLAVEEFANFIVMLPIQASAACFKHNNNQIKFSNTKETVILPQWMKPYIYPQKVIDIVLTGTLSVSTSGDKVQMQYLFETLLWKVIQHGGVKDAVLGLYATWFKRQQLASDKNDIASYLPCVPILMDQDYNNPTISDRNISNCYYEDVDFKRICLDSILVFDRRSNSRETNKYSNSHGTRTTDRQRSQHDFCKLIQCLFLYASSSSFSNNDMKALFFLQHAVLPVMQSAPTSLRTDIFNFIMIQNPPLHSTKEASLLPYNSIIPKFMALILAKCSMHTAAQKNEETYSPLDRRNRSLDVLFFYLHEVCAVWCETTFINRSQYSHQRFLTIFILESFKIVAACSAETLSEGNNSEENNENSSTEMMQHHDIVTMIVSGVSARLDSSFDMVRQDGMKVAEKFAPLIGQEQIRFEELHGEQKEQKSLDSCMHGEKHKDTRSDSNTIASEQKAKSLGRKKLTKEKKKTSAAFAVVDPDEEYISDDNGGDNDEEEDFSMNEYHSNLKRNKTELHLDDDSYSDGWNDDNFSAYDLSDDEEDLRPVKRPVYIQECLELLRTSDDDTDAYCKHEEAMKQIASIIRSKPYDLTDFSVQLAKELLHIENKFDIPGFSDNVCEGLTALAVCEPRPVAIEYFIRRALFLDSSVSTGTRLLILDILMYAAEELSGGRGSHTSRVRLPKSEEEADSSNQTSLLMMVTERVSGKRRLVKSTPDEDALVIGTISSRAEKLEARTRRWGNRRDNDPETVRNEFGPLCSAFFYPLVTAFITSKENSTLWSRGDGARLMAKVIITLSCFVQCSGHHSGTHAIAYDLFNVIWEFHNAESPTVRQAVLVGVATCVMFFSSDDLIKIILDKSDLPLFLIDNTVSDFNGDDQCRQLAASVLASIHKFSNDLVCLT